MCVLPPTEAPKTASKEPPAPAPKILEAEWETRDRGIVVLDEDWTYRWLPTPIFLDEAGTERPCLLKAPPQVFGEMAAYFVQSGQLVFLLRPEDYPNFNDLHSEATYVAGSWNDWENPVGQEQWRLHWDRMRGRDVLVLRVPLERCLTGGPHQFKFVTDKHIWLEVPQDAPNREPDGTGSYNFELRANRTGRNIFYFTPEKGGTAFSGISQLFWVEGGRVEAVNISFGELVSEIVSTRPLGALVTRETTTFRLFAPRASSVEVGLYREVDGPCQRHAMTRLEDMTWEVTLPGNLHGRYYHYFVDGRSRGKMSHFDASFPILDPYAWATVGREGPGIVVDPAKLPRVKERFEPPSWHDLVILEAHVRDLLQHAPIELTEQERRGFRGLTKWLREPDCYLRTLGINAVELQPVQEFDNPTYKDYHWGYMTNNYFSPESSYALKPEKGSQIEEFRELVQAFHEAGIAVILDVVYNHVGEPNHLLFIDKQYYFETDHDGNLANWSGCGNDFRAHAPMALRLITDSLIHLIETYDVDGFRFDLAELLGVDVLQSIEQALKPVKPSLILIAEPWSFRGHIGHALRHTGFSSWNDGYRDFIGKYVRAQGNRDGIIYFLSGSPDHLARWPAQTVNYTESHDDRCWLDRITENRDHNGDFPTARDRRRTHLMCSLLFMSIGIPMLSQGQDFLRSKQGINNTYQRGDINALQYGRITEYPGTHAYFREWIAFRQGPLGKLLRLEARPGPEYFRWFWVDDTSSVAVLINADGSMGHQRLLYAVNPHEHGITFEVGDLRAANFTQVADHERFLPKGLGKACFRWRGDRLELPRVSCGLWVSA